MASARQSQTQSYEAKDSRFAALLKPIKDLTENWEVPLAEYLEEYLDEIQNIQIKFDGTQTTINFAQAGLLLQGTASVYSKKVDYLWTQLLKMLEHLTRKKGLYNDYLVCEDGQVDETGRVKKKARIDMTAEFEELMAEVANNIDIKSDHACVSGRKGELKFIFPTPRQLIDKLGSQGKQIKVNIFLGRKFELLGAKEDFRVNNQYVTSSGMLGEDLSVDDRDTNSSASFATEDSIDLFDFSSNTSMQRDEKVTTEMERTCMESAEMEMTCAGDILGDDGEYSFAEWIDDASEVVEAGDRSAYSAVVEKSLEMADERSPSTKDVLTEDGLNVTEEVDLFDPWEPLDPHAVNQTPNKALVIGRVSKYPPSILEQRARAKEGNAGGPERLPVIVPIEQFLAAEMTGRKTRFPRIEPEFYDLALKEQKRRKDSKAQQRKRKQSDQQTVEQFSVEEDHDDADDFCDDVNEDEDIGDVDCEDLDIDGDENEDLPDPHLGGDIGIIAMDDDYSPPEEADQPAFSYEALVAKRVAEFLQRSQSLIQTSDLTKRVSAWHDHMAPRLEIIEKRKNFDIHQYGSRLLAFFTGQRRIFSLSEFMRDKPGEEIARFFLSTLMLANTMNVRVGIEPDTDEELGMVKTEVRDGTTGGSHNPYIAFRRRTEKMQTRKNRKNDEVSYEKMLKLRRDLNRAVMLLELVRRREKLKKEKLVQYLDIFDKRYEAQDFSGTLYNEVNSVKHWRVLQPQYNNLPAWSSSVGSAGSPQEGIAINVVKKEKRKYKKKRHLSSRPLLQFRGDRPALLTAMLSEPISSDDDRSLSSVDARQTRQEEMEQDENVEVDGPFSFRRRAGVQYHAPVDDGAWPWEGGDDKFQYRVAAVQDEYGGKERCLGFCSRRMGRGGRVVVDRLSSRWDHLWRDPDVDLAQDSLMVRPVTPEEMRDEWDPYRIRDVEACY